MKDAHNSTKGSNGRRPFNSSIPGSGGGAAADEELAAAAEDQPPIRKRGSASYRRFLTLLLIFSAFVAASSAAFVEDVTPTRSGFDLEASRTLPHHAYGEINTGLFGNVLKRQNAPPVAYTCACPLPKGKGHGAGWYVEVVLIPILVILAGIFAGLTLGYMSLDMNQLQVLAKTGTPKQKRQAERIIPLRRNGHLLLVSLLLCNMAASETLPVVSEPVLGGGIQSVIVSTVLVIVFSEIVPQSVCSRFGLQIGAFMVWPTRIVIGVTFIVSWPVSKLLEYLLGAHSGVVYRRAELKELINMHGDTAEHGGDLNKDTITIVGATLDLQEKVVRDAMTHSDKVFMLDINAKLDYATLTKILKSGHSRIPVYEEIVPSKHTNGQNGKDYNKKIIGGLLTKQLILLDPEDAVPLRDLPLNPFPTVPENMPLLHILNTFQEGRSHMAMVARAPVLPQLKRITTHDTENISEGDDHPHFFRRSKTRTRSRSSSSPVREINNETVQSSPEKDNKHFFRGLIKRDNVEKVSDEEQATSGAISTSTGHKRHPSEPTEKAEDIEMTAIPDPDDIVGLITLEDVLEELIGEEIEDEFDSEPLTGRSAAEPYIPAEAKYHIANTSGIRKGFGLPTPFSKPSGPVTGNGMLGISPKQFEEKSAFHGDGTAITGSNMPKEGVLTAFKRNTLGMARSASAPGRRRNTNDKPETISSEKSLPKDSAAAIAQPHVDASKPGYFGLKTDPGSTVLAASPATMMDDTLRPSEEGEPSNQAQGLDLISERSYESDDGQHLDARARGRRRSLDDRLPPPNATLSLDPETGQSRRGRPLPIAPLLSDALLLERGRRQLKAKGQDPDTLTLRLASRSSTPLAPLPAATNASGSGNSTPRAESGPLLPGSHYLVVPAPGKQSSSASGVINTAGYSLSQAPPGSGIRKQSFKTPLLSATAIPVRAAAKQSRPDTPKQGVIAEERPSKQDPVKEPVITDDVAAEDKGNVQE